MESHEITHSWLQPWDDCVEEERGALGSNVVGWSSVARETPEDENIPEDKSSPWDVSIVSKEEPRKKFDEDAETLS